MAFLAIAGATIAGSLISASAAGDAASAQSAAARQAADTQAAASKYATDANVGMFNTLQGQTAPWRQAGQSGLNAIAYGLGLPQTNPVSTQTYNPGQAVGSTSGSTPISSMGGPLTLDQITQQLQASGKYDSQSQVANSAGPNGDLAVGMYGGGGVNTAQLNADAQAQFNAQGQSPTEQPTAVAPTGDPTSGGLSSGQFTHQFNASDLNANLAPNYQFMLNQGLGALNNQASVSGGLVGGNALQGIENYAQNYAQNGYQQAYDNYNANQNNIFNRLSTIAGYGSTANAQSAASGNATAGNIGNIATTTAGNIGSAQLAGGASQAAGIVGGANALSGGLGNISSMYQLNNLTGGKFFGGGTTSAPMNPDFMAG